MGTHVKTAALIDTYAQLPFAISGGQGSRVRDDTGREYWDFYGGHAVALLGHAHPVVTRAISEQAARLTFYSNVAPLAIRTTAAERLCAFAPAGIEHVFFCNSGSEANENALKTAIQHTGRKKIAALNGAFHGRTLLSLAATAKETLRRSFVRWSALPDAALAAQCAERAGSDGYVGCRRDRRTDPECRRCR